MRTLGRVISDARKAAGLTQRDLAALVLRESGERGISAAYLNDIEHDRRTPNGSYLMTQLAQALYLDPEYLLVLARGQVPEDVMAMASRVDQDTYRDALRLFRTTLQKKEKPESVSPVPPSDGSSG